MEPDWLTKARAEGRITSERYATPPAPVGDLPEPEAKKPKYRNRKTMVAGRMFDSEKEAKRYKYLSLLLAAGEIADLEIQVKFVFIINNFRVGSYRADFRYKDVISGSVIVEDVKSPGTRGERAYVLRKKLLKAIHGIDITEV